MKKNILSWMTIMLMAFVCVGFTACGGDGDDDGKGGGSSSSNPLVGTWKAKLNEAVGKGNVYLEFKANGTGREYYDQYDYDDSFQYIIVAYSDNIKSGVLRVTFADGQQADYVFKIGSNSLSIEGWGTYYK